MSYAKSVLVGFVGSLLMFGVMVVGIHVTGVAPFNMPPSAAFLEAFGLNVGPLALVVHFGYGGFWSAVLFAAFGRQTTVWHGLGLAGVLWLVMMLVLSPIIGWGVFGTTAGTQPAEAALALTSTPKYIGMTALLHVLFGVVIGWLNPRWAG